MTDGRKYPRSKYKAWLYRAGTSIPVEVSARGTFEEVQVELQPPHTYSVWDHVEDTMQEIREEAAKNKVEALTFEVYSDSNEDMGSVAIEGTGYVLLTEKQKIAQDKKDERERLADAAAIRKKIKQEKQMLEALLKKHPQTKA